MKDKPGIIRYVTVFRKLCTFMSGIGSKRLSWVSRGAVVRQAANWVLLLGRRPFVHLAAATMWCLGFAWALLGQLHNKVIMLHFILTDLKG